MRIACVCTKGWIKNVGAQWPDPCPVCEGYGELSAGRLAELNGEYPKLVKNVAELRARASTAARFFGKLTDLLERIGK